MNTRYPFVFSALLFLFAVQPDAVAASPSSQDILQGLQEYHYGTTSLSSIVGLIDNEGRTRVSPLGNLTGDDSFRIGSQSKTFSSTVVLTMVANGWLSLDDSLNDLQAKYPGLVDTLTPMPADAGAVTVRQLLNMSSGIPNYMGGTPAGGQQTLWDLWKGVQYGSVPGLSGASAHQTLVELGWQGYPQTPAAGYEGSYSNTNAVILGLVAETIYAQHEKATKSFAEILAEMVLVPSSLSHTSLQMQGTAGPTSAGTEAGIAVSADFDPTIPWTSGAVVSTMADMLTWLRTYTQNITAEGGTLLPAGTFAARTAKENTTLISIGGIPIDYGLGVMILDFSDIMGLSAIGHGGSVAGASSFSTWVHTTSGISDLDLGLIVYVNSLTSIDAAGNFTITPAELLFVSALAHLSRNARADGACTNDGGTTTCTPGDLGGETTTETMNLTGPLVVKASNRSTLYLDLTPGAGMDGGPLRMTIDPTYTYYPAADDADDANDTHDTEDEIAIQTNNAVTLATGARIEGYGGDKADGARFVLLQLSGSGSDEASIFNGEAAAFGKNAVAVQLLDRSGTVFGNSSTLFVQGNRTQAGGAALEVLNTGVGDMEVEVKGALKGLGAVSGLVASGSSDANTTISLTETASVQVQSTGSSMNAQFETIDPYLHAAYGIEVDGHATVILKGQAQASAKNPWDGKAYDRGAYIADTAMMPGVVTAGVKLSGNDAVVEIDGGAAQGDSYGVYLTGTGLNTLTVSNGGRISGRLSPLYADGGRQEVLLDNAILVGPVSFAATSDAGSTLTTRNNTLIRNAYDTVFFQGVPALDLSGAMLEVTGLAPLGSQITLATGYDAKADLLNLHPAELYDLSGLLRYTLHQDDDLATLSATVDFAPGLRANIRGLYPALVDYSAGTAGTWANQLAQDADALSPEGVTTQPLQGLRQHQTLTDSALAMALSTTSGQGLMPANLNALTLETSRSLGMGGPNDQEQVVVAPQGIIAAWAPALTSSRTLLGRPEGLKAQAGPSGQTAVGGIHLFGGYVGGFSDQQDRDGYAGFDADSNGFILGATTQLASDRTLGSYLGWSEGETRVNLASSRIATTHLQAGLFARQLFPIDDRLTARLTGNMASSQIDNDSRREVESDVLAATMQASFDQHILGGGLEAALDWTPAFDAATKITPYLALNYAHLHQDAVQETGALSLATDSLDDDACSSTLGLSWARDLAISAATLLTPRATAGWRRQFGDRDSTSTSHFVDHSLTFDTRSVQEGRDALLLGLSLDGLTRTTGNQTIGFKAAYGLATATDHTDHQIFVGLEYTF